jgi:hypothetical protein
MIYLGQRIMLGVLCAAIMILIIHAGIRVILRHRPAEWPLQTLTRPRSSFVDEATRVVLYTSQLAHLKRPMILVVGGSAAQEGYLPANIVQLAPGFDSHNLALAGPNMTEVEQVLSEVVKAAPPDIMRRSTLVISLTYAMFSPDSVRWRNPDLVSASEIEKRELATDIDRGVMRCPLVYNLKVLFGRDSPRWLERIVLAHYRGYLELSRRLPSGITNLHLPLRRLWAFDPRRPRAHEADAAAESQRDQAPVQGGGPQAEGKNQLAFLDRFMGGQRGAVPIEQFERLMKIIDRARKAGFHVVVVNMPLPTWHLNATSYFTPYHVELNKTLAPLIRGQSVVYVDLTGTVPDDAFRDSSHPKESEAMNWSKVLVSHLDLSGPEFIEPAKNRQFVDLRPNSRR